MRISPCSRCPTPRAGGSAQRGARDHVHDQPADAQPSLLRKLLLIDEAWSMLKGGSMGEFVETYARTCRKYGGALATATQSLNDYYKSDGATQRWRIRPDADPAAGDDRRFRRANASIWTIAPRR